MASDHVHAAFRSTLDLIAGQNHADPATDDLTVPLAVECARLQAVNLGLLNALQSYVTHAEGWEALQPLSFEAQRRLDQARAAIRAHYDGEEAEHQRQTEDYAMQELEYLRNSEGC